jgi:drug/metabolite transporter (DMT)-like permease
MTDATAGNAAFITGLYMVLVPLAVVFQGRRVGASTVLGIVAAVAGLYLIAFRGPFAVHRGDALLMASAVVFAAQILVVDRYARRLSALRFSVAQFFSCAVLSGVAALVLDAHPFGSLNLALWPLFYTGVLSVGIAYTLQVIGQRDAIASHAALIMSLETVFGAVGGAVFLGENMGVRGYCGAALMLAGIVISQLGSVRRGAAKAAGSG